MGTFVTGAFVQSRIEGQNKVHVPVHGEPAWELPLRPPQHMEPSYDSVYQDVHRAQLHRISTLVQSPNIGTFTHTDLTWACDVRVKGRRTDPRTPKPVSVAYIPWARVQDFVKGEEARSDAPSKFVCQGAPTNASGKLMFPRWNSYSVIFRYFCNMLPSDDNARFNVTRLPHLSPLLYMTLTVSTWSGPHPTGIIVNMDQMTMHRTYHWLQRTCTRRKKS
jgi:hypothetical protein